MATAVAVAPTHASAEKPETGREEEDDIRWRRVLGLPCGLTVDLAMPDFKVADLLKLRVGSVINAHWSLGRDVPLRLNGTLLGWSEFEVVADNLAVRVTELA
jgi:flagellar motor switch/type III secretory pathway protein FliN